MKYTFNQISALILAGCCLIILGLLLFIPTRGTNPDLVIGAIIGAFSTSVMFLVKSSSDSAHADTTKQLIDGLSNSTPVQTTNNPVQTTKNS
jgi:hypothetical protein